MSDMRGRELQTPLLCNRQCIHTTAYGQLQILWPNHRQNRIHAVACCRIVCPQTAMRLGVTLAAITITEGQTLLRGLAGCGKSHLRNRPRPHLASSLPSP